MKDIKDTIARIVIGFIVLITALTLMAVAKIIYESTTKINYNKAICQVNGEMLEITINKIKKLENGEYLFTDDKGEQWQFSSRICTFVEE